MDFTDKKAINVFLEDNEIKDLAQLWSSRVLQEQCWISY
jgi:hypothetical protein